MNVNWKVWAKRKPIPSHIRQIGFKENRCLSIRYPGE